MVIEEGMRKPKDGSTARRASFVLLPALLVAGALALATAPTPARADAVPPAPKDCPRGQVGVTSHSGPQCLLEAPTDCPKGWRGLVGGTCALTPCENDTQCSGGEVCVQHSVCLEPSQDDSYDYGEDEREEHGEAAPRSLLQSPALLAGPMMPRKKRPTPIYRYAAVNLCSADVACASPRTCQTEKLCVPKGARAAAYRGTNVSPTRVARKTATILAASDAAATEATAPPPVKRGCAGCAATESAPSSGAGLGALGLLVAALAMRRGGQR